MQVITIAFHDVVKDSEPRLPRMPGHTAMYTLTRSELRDHLTAVRSRAGDRAVGLLEQQPACPVPVLVTFDDGTLGAYDSATPELEMLGWHAYYFVTTDWIDKKGFMGPQQIRALRRRGDIIGSHSCSHPERISKLGWDDLLREWTDSCARLADILGEAVTTASVPGGYYSRRVAYAAAAAGINMLFTSEPVATVNTQGGCLVLGRYSVRRCTPPAVTGAIAAGELLAWRRQLAAWMVKKAARRIAGPWYEPLRRVLLAGVK